MWEMTKDLLFPRRCVVCDDVMPLGRQYFCKECKSKIIYIKEPICLKCGKELLMDSTEEYCTDCKNRFHEFESGRAALDYGSFADSIFRFKNKGRQEYSKFFARALYESQKDFLRLINPDFLVPVPIHKTKMSERGYNQSELIANELSRLSNIPVISNLILRTKNTKALKELGANERQNNLKKAFKIGTFDVKLKSIVIIDDIYTTGSTIDEISRTIREKFDCKIYFLTITIGRGI